MGKNFLTNGQRRRKERNGKICFDYLSMRESNPSDSRNSIMEVIAMRYDLDKLRIRQILIEGGVYAVNEAS